MTTRQPDDDQIEVAIRAMETALAADEGRELSTVPQETKSTSETNSDEHG